MFGLGFAEAGIIAVVAVLLFGSRLPKIARSVGSSIVEFRRGLNQPIEEIKEIESDIKDNLKDIEKEVNKVKDVVNVQK